jgi:hypothetical protein
MLSSTAELTDIQILVLTWLLVFAMNAVTFPLPPAWTVLAAIRTATSVALVPLTVGGSAAATLGRMLFARQVNAFTGRLSASERANAEALAAAANSRARWPWLFVVIYSFLPLPSDPVFIAVGLGALPAASSFLAFFLARSVFNTLMVLAAGPAVSNLTDLFAGRFSWSSILVVLVSAAGYVLFLKLPWTRWLVTQKRPAPRYPTGVSKFT